MTLKDFLALWRLQGCGQPVSPGWRKERHDAVERYLLRDGVALRTIEFSQFTAANLLQIQAGMISRGLAPITVNKLTHDALRALFRDAELIGYNIGTALDAFKRVRRLREDRRSERGPFTAQEREYILKRFRLHQPPEYSAYVAWLFATGMRISEALGLRWGAVSLENKRVRIHRGRVRYGESMCKTRRSRRTCKLNRRAIAALAGLDRRDDDELVFITPSGTPINRVNFQRRVWVPELKAISGQVSYRPHACTRHTFICDALDSGITPSKVAAYIGDDLETVLRCYYEWRGCDVGDDIWGQTTNDELEEPSPLVAVD